MSKGAKADWYGESVVLAVGLVADAFLLQVAAYIESEAKVRANVDTGFMRNSIYFTGPGLDTRTEAEAKASAAADRPMAPVVKVEEHTAAVHCAAKYAIAQETLNGFMYRGLEKGVQATGGMIVKTAKEQGL